MLINALSNYVPLTLNIVTGLFLTPFIIGHLGKYGYGIWTLTLTLVGYYGLINLGVESAVNRYVAFHKGRGDQNALNQTASTAIVMFCLTGTIVAVISLTTAEVIVGFFKIDPGQIKEFSTLIKIVGIAIALSFPDEALKAILRGHEKYVLTNIATVTNIIVRTLAVVLLLEGGKGLVGVGIATVLGYSTSLIFNTLNVLNNLPRLRISLKLASFSFLTELITFGGITTIIILADHLRMNIDNLVIGKFLGMGEVGVYGLAFVIIRYTISLVTSAMNVLTPRFAVLYGEQNSEAIKKLFGISSSISSFLAFGCGLGLIAYGAPFIKLWVGEEFQASVNIIYVLFVPFTVALAQNPGIPLLYAIKKHHFFATVTFIEGLANFILSIILVKNYGIVGVALGTAIPMLIVKIFIQPIYISYVLKIKILEYVAPFSAPFLAFILCASVFKVFVHVNEIQFESWVSMVLSIIVTGIIYTITTSIVMNRESRSIIINRIVTLR